MERLAKLKASRMKELVLKRRSELEEICRLTHIQPDTSTAAEKSSALIDSGLFPVPIMINYLLHILGSYINFLLSYICKIADIYESNCS